MNGVINIITKSAKNTKGGTIVAGTGSETRTDGLIQYGGSIGSKGAYRVFGRYFDVGSFRLANGSAAGDGEQTTHGGFRSDWDLSSRDTMTIQGDLARLNGGQTYSTVFSNALPLEKTIHDRVEMNSGNVLGRWNRAFPGGSGISLQVYDDYYNRINSGLRDIKNTIDLDFQDHLVIASRQDIVWGLGARVTTGHFDPGYSVSVSPRGRTDLLLSMFFQDEVRISRNLWLTLGSKFEHNSYTGFEFEPGGKLVWMPAKQHEIWVSAARAIRQPNVIDAGIEVDAAILPIAGAPFGLVKLLGNPDDFDAEQLTDFEGGYRAQLNPRLSLDVAAFLSIYTHLQTSEPQAPYFTTNPGPPHVVFPLVFDDQAHARNYGGETFLNWSVTKRWRIGPGYSMLRMFVKRYPDSRDSTVEQTPGQSPGRQFQIRSSLILPHHVEWDASLAHVGPLSSAGVPGYTRVDTRLGWRWGERLEFSMVGQNLLRRRHAEFFDSFGLNHSEIERSVFGKIVWRF
jgi:iron complex outermembrane receptor protein